MKRSWRVAVTGLVLSLSSAVLGVTLVASSGRPALASAAEKHGSVEQEPGWYPAADPESASVRLGRRVSAPLVSKRFLGGTRNLSDLGRAVCRALSYENMDSLFVLCLRRDEFCDIMWPEFPQSRPATGIKAGDGWMFLEARYHGGVNNALNEYGGRRWKFVRFDRYDSTQAFKNFKLHKGLVMWAEDETGHLERMTWFRAAVERKGRFKVYSLKD